MSKTTAKARLLAAAATLKPTETDILALSQQDDEDVKDYGVAKNDPREIRAAAEKLKDLEQAANTQPKSLTNPFADTPGAGGNGTTPQPNAVPDDPEDAEPDEPEFTPAPKEEEYIEVETEEVEGTPQREPAQPEEGDEGAALPAESEETPDAEGTPLEGSLDEKDVQLALALEELAEQRRENKRLEDENRQIIENGPQSLKLDPKFFDSKRKAQELESQVEGLKEILAHQANEIENLRKNGGAGACSAPQQPEEELWKGKEVRLLLPWGKLVNPVTALTPAFYGMLYGREKLGLIPMFGDSMIYNIRNVLAHQFLETGAEWSFWLDDDVLIPWGAPQMLRDFCGATPAEMPDRIVGINGLETLIKSGKKLIGGVYFGRRFGAPPMFGAAMKDGSVQAKCLAADPVPIATDWVATGALLVHRSVYLDIQKKFPELAPRTAKNPNDHWQYFAPEPGKGEDVMFCHRAKEAGHQPYAHPGVSCLHVGFVPFGFHNNQALSARQAPQLAQGRPATLSGTPRPGQGPAAPTNRWGLPANV